MSAIDEFLAIAERTHEFSPGRGDAHVVRWQEQKGIMLPGDLAYFWARCSRVRISFWDMYEIDQTLDIATEWIEAGIDVDPIDVEPEGPVAQSYFSDAWLPIFCNDNLALCADLQPAPGGSLGQIILARTDSLTRSVAFRSITDLCQRLVDDVSEGRLTIKAVGSARRLMEEGTYLVFQS